MTPTKFLVKVKRKGALSPQYVHSMDRNPIQMTSNRKLALVMGKFAAEDAIKAIEQSRCHAELVMVTVTA